MMTVRRVSFMLPCLMACLIGCRPETVHDEVGEPPREEVRQPPLDEKDREVEKGLKRLHTSVTRNDTKSTWGGSLMPHLAYRPMQTNQGRDCNNWIRFALQQKPLWVVRNAMTTG